MRENPAKDSSSGLCLGGCPGGARIRDLAKYPTQDVGRTGGERLGRTGVGHWRRATERIVWDSSNRCDEACVRGAYSL
jgi:hypothetical protein